MELRIKVYDKFLALFQSESAAKSIGMNTRSIFYSSAHMYRALREASHDGLTRIEISYNVHDCHVEQMLLNEQFPKMAEFHLDVVQLVLFEVRNVGLGVKLPMTRMYEHFQRQAKGKQLYVQMKHTAALIYAANDKPSCFTGFFQHIPKSGRFDHLDFIAAHALPGPDSKINCIVQKDGPDGEEVRFSLKKSTPLS